MIKDNKGGIVMEIIKFKQQYLDSLNILLHEAFAVMKTGSAKNEDYELIAITNDEVIGYLTLNLNIDCVTGEKYFHVNYVCVKQNYQGHGIATKLFDEVFSICKKEQIAYLELTSNPKRIAAHHLYDKLGFIRRDTTVFRKELL